MNADMNSVLKILDVLLLYIVLASQNTDAAVCYCTHNPSLLKEKKYIKKKSHLLICMVYRSAIFLCLNVVIIWYNLEETS